MEKFNITRQNSVFLLIDFQTNLTAAMSKKVTDAVEMNIHLMITACNNLNIPILVTEQYRKGLGMTVESLRTKLGNSYLPIDKADFNVCANEEFRGMFAKYDKRYVIVAGTETHICVLQSALDFLANGYFVHVLSDAVCSRYKNDWKTALDYMRDAGSVISTTEIVIFQLLQKAGTAEFKAISALLKNR